MWIVGLAYVKSIIFLLFSVSLRAHEIFGLALHLTLSLFFACLSAHVQSLHTHPLYYFHETYFRNNHSSFYVFLLWIFLLFRHILPFMFHKLIKTNLKRPWIGDLRRACMDGKALWLEHKANIKEELKKKDNIGVIHVYQGWMKNKTGHNLSQIEVKTTGSWPLV